MDVSIEETGEDHLALPVDDLVRAFGRDVLRLADGDKSAVLDGNGAVTDDAAILVDGDQVVDVVDDESGHGASGISAGEFCLLRD